MVSLNFGIGERIKISGAEHDIQGVINYYSNEERYVWSEYKLIDINTGQIKWLSIDDKYGQCAIYIVAQGNNYNRDSILSNGYKSASSGTARVQSYSGNIDVDVNESVRFEEFEDGSEQNIIAMEAWSDGIEYSTGYYLNANQIQRVYQNNTMNNETRVNNTIHEQKRKKKVPILAIIVWLIITAIIFGAGLMGINKASKNVMAKSMTEQNGFTYVTSITSDLENKQKADVYSTTSSVEDAAKKILEQIGNNLEEVQENTEDQSVAITTKYEYALVYKSEDEKTLVQVSSREYTYGSNNGPYRARYATGLYYRNYYRTFCYIKDKTRYKNSTYSTANDSADGLSSDKTSTTNKYKTYSSDTAKNSSSSSSVRQKSSTSRSSSGGGTSSGK